MKRLEKDVLEVLKSDARLSAKQVAAAVGADEQEVKACIDGLEKSGAIVKYTAPTSVEGFDGIAKQIAAFPEVKGVYLMSGAYDLAVFIEDASLQKVARFVSERISTFSGVISTATHFILKKYKLEGVCTESEQDRRISIQA